MIKAEAIAKLRALEPDLRAMGADGLFLFGSTARGDQGPSSDVDVLLDIVPGMPFTLLDIAAARRLMTHGLQTTVDLTTRDDLSPEIGRKVLEDAVRVF